MQARNDFTENDPKDFNIQSGNSTSLLFVILLLIKIKQTVINTSYLTNHTKEIKV